MYTQDTPNPLSRKFFSDGVVFADGYRSFFDPKEAEGFPVIDEIMSLPGVACVFVAPDFITVTKEVEDKWSLLESVILTILRHKEKDFPLNVENILDDASQAVSQKGLSAEGLEESFVYDSQELQEIVQEIEELLAARVRPGIEADGGAIMFHGFKDGIVYVRLEGACSACPHSQETLKEGIETLLRHFIPEVQEVRALGLS